LKPRLDSPPRGGFKMLRVLLLLLVLLTVALTTWQDRYRSTRWREPLYVAIYPIAAAQYGWILSHGEGNVLSSNQSQSSIMLEHIRSTFACCLPAHHPPEQAYQTSCAE